MIYYGYQQALAKFPKQDESSSAKANKAAKKPRQDLWVSLPFRFPPLRSLFSAYTTERVPTLMTGDVRLSRRI